MRLFRKSANKKGFSGSWKHRVGDLFRCGVEFHRRSVLDAGCNVGILSYEIAKHEPRFIQGIDQSKEYIYIARRIFLGVTVESRFDCVDISRYKALSGVLLPQYDIVVFLSVYHQLRRSHGTDVAARTLRLLLSRCREDFILRVPQASFLEADAIVAEAGFDKTFSGVTLPEDRGGDSRFHAYRRATRNPPP